MQDWLTARAQATPTKVALVAEEVSLSYADLFQQVRLLTGAMDSLSIRHGSRGALLARSSAQTVLMIHALIQLGAVIVPLNTQLVHDEIRYQIVQSECDWLLYDDRQFAEIVQKIGSTGLKAITTEKLFAVGNISPVPPLEIDLNAPMAIIHTSGSSGKPKGAVLTYGNFFYSAMASAYRLGTLPDDRWLCVLPLYHVGGLSILVRTVLYGITVDLHPRFDLDAVNHALDTQPITLISLVPTMLHRLLDIRAHWPESLRLILLGGAAASPELLARCREMNLPVATTYGLTEAASQVATMLPEDVRRKPGSVGKPLLLTNIRIVKANNEAAAPGEYGEIVVSGPTVMQGYFNGPDATAETLRNGELHTGDIGYLDDEGDLWVVQRRSDLIVSGGENVYPAEVEQVLRQHPAVADVCIVGVDDTEWGQQVAAAVVLQNGKTITEADLITYGRAHLAGYKLPRRVLFVDALPQTSSGKVQRAAVQSLFMDQQ